MKTLAFFFSCLIGSCPAAANEAEVKAQNLVKLEGQPTYERYIARPYNYDSFSGNYLAAQFAQRRHDWDKARRFLSEALEQYPEDLSLINKAMVLSIGVGRMEEAGTYAKTILENSHGEEVLPPLFLALDAFEKQDYELASQMINRLPPGSLSDFIKPVLQGWLAAAQGENLADVLTQNTLHTYHAMLISDYLGQKDIILPLSENILRYRELSLHDVERLANIYIYIDKNDLATKLYEKIVTEWPENRLAARRLEALKAGEALDIFRSVKTPAEGVASALYDMARLLYHENSDDSARVFAHMTLHLDPSLTNAHLLLGYIAARNNRYEEATAHYRSITPDNDQYLEARRMAADMLEDAGRLEDAIHELNNLVHEHRDLEALIQIGDIYRRNDEFKKAVAKYNQAEEWLGGDITREYWQLYYVRGMSYERMGEWEKAERDLQAALEYQPHHPLILNYLGYAWADQGVNLKQSLELIRKAVALKPMDGYITDSLGWVLYRMGHYEEAVPHLERAVELLPYDPVINDHLGDAYWKVGRKLEARFQWLRAKNHTDDKALRTTLEAKLESGLQDIAIVKEAKSTQTSSDITE